MVLPTLMGTEIEESRLDSTNAGPIFGDDVLLRRAWPGKPWMIGGITRDLKDQKPIRRCRSTASSLDAEFEARDRGTTSSPLRSVKNAPKRRQQTVESEERSRITSLLDFEFKGGRFVTMVESRAAPM